MSHVLKILPEPFVFGGLKKPYDPEFHLLIKGAAQQSMRYLVGYARALVTDRAVLFVSSEDIPLRVLSYFTAHANRNWNGRGIVAFMADLYPVLTLDEYDEPLKTEQKRIEVLSKSSYEMYLEEHRFDIEGGLFPEYTFLPYDKTPEYYQRGVILTK